MDTAQNPALHSQLHPALHSQPHPGLQPVQNLGLHPELHPGPHPVDKLQPELHPASIGGQAGHAIIADARSSKRKPSRQSRRRSSVRKRVTTMEERLSTAAVDDGKLSAVGEPTSTAVAAAVTDSSSRTVDERNSTAAVKRSSRASVAVATIDAPVAERRSRGSAGILDAPLPQRRSRGSTGGIPTDATVSYRKSTAPGGRGSRGSVDAVDAPVSDGKSTAAGGPGLKGSVVAVDAVAANRKSTTTRNDVVPSRQGSKQGDGIDLSAIPEENEVARNSGTEDEEITMFKNSQRNIVNVYDTFSDLIPEHDDDAVLGIPRVISFGGQVSKEIPGSEPRERLLAQAPDGMGGAVLNDSERKSALPDASRKSAPKKSGSRGSTVDNMKREGKKLPSRRQPQRRRSSVDGVGINQKSDGDIQGRQVKSVRASATQVAQRQEALAGQLESIRAFAAQQEALAGSATQHGPLANLADMDEVRNENFKSVCLGNADLRGVDPRYSSGASSAEPNPDLRVSPRQEQMHPHATLQFEATGIDSDATLQAEDTGIHPHDALQFESDGIHDRDALQFDSDRIHSEGGIHFEANHSPQGAVDFQSHHIPMAGGYHLTSHDVVEHHHDPMIVTSSHLISTQQTGCETEDQAHEGNSSLTLGAANRHTWGEKKSVLEMSLSGHVPVGNVPRSGGTGSLPASFLSKASAPVPNAHSAPSIFAAFSLIDEKDVVLPSKKKTAQGQELSGSLVAEFGLVRPDEGMKDRSGRDLELVGEFGMNDPADEDSHARFLFGQTEKSADTGTTSEEAMLTHRLNQLEDEHEKLIAMLAEEHVTLKEHAELSNLLSKPGGAVAAGVDPTLLQSSKQHLEKSKKRVKYLNEKITQVNSDRFRVTRMLQELEEENLGQREAIEEEMRADAVEKERRREEMHREEEARKEKQREEERSAEEENILPNQQTILGEEERERLEAETVDQELGLAGEKVMLEEKRLKREEQKSIEEEQNKFQEQMPFLDQNEKSGLEENERICVEEQRAEEERLENEAASHAVADAEKLERHLELLKQLKSEEDIKANNEAQFAEEQAQEAASKLRNAEEKKRMDEINEAEAREKKKNDDLEQKRFLEMAAAPNPMRIQAPYGHIPATYSLVNTFFAAGSPPLLQGVARIGSKYGGGSLSGSLTLSMETLKNRDPRQVVCPFRLDRDKGVAAKGGVVGFQDEGMVAFQNLQTFGGKSGANALVSDPNGARISGAHYVSPNVAYRESNQNVADRESNKSVTVSVADRFPSQIARDRERNASVFRPNSLQNQIPWSHSNPQLLNFHGASVHRVPGVPFNNFDLGCHNSPVESSSHFRPRPGINPDKLAKQNVANVQIEPTKKNLGRSKETVVSKDSAQMAKVHVTRIKGSEENIRNRKKNRRRKDVESEQLNDLFDQLYGLQSNLEGKHQSPSGKKMKNMNATQSTFESGDLIDRISRSAKQKTSAITEQISADAFDKYNIAMKHARDQATNDYHYQYLKEQRLAREKKERELKEKREGNRILIERAKQTLPRNPLEKAENREKLTNAYMKGVKGFSNLHTMGARYGTDTAKTYRQTYGADYGANGMCKTEKLVENLKFVGGNIENRPAWKPGSTRKMEQTLPKQTMSIYVWDKKIDERRMAERLEESKLRQFTGSAFASRLPVSLSAAPAEAVVPGVVEKPVPIMKQLLWADRTRLMKEQTEAELAKRRANQPMQIDTLSKTASATESIATREELLAQETILDKSRAAAESPAPDSAVASATAGSLTVGSAAGSPKDPTAGSAASATGSGKESSVEEGSATGPIQIAGSEANQPRGASSGKEYEEEEHPDPGEPPTSFWSGLFGGSSALAPTPAADASAAAATSEPAEERPPASKGSWFSALVPTFMGGASAEADEETEEDRLRKEEEARKEAEFDFRKYSLSIMNSESGSGEVQGGEDSESWLPNAMLDPWVDPRKKSRWEAWQIYHEKLRVMAEIAAAEDSKRRQAKARRFGKRRESMSFKR